MQIGLIDGPLEGAIAGGDRSVGADNDVTIDACCPAVRDQDDPDASLEVL